MYLFVYSGREDINPRQTGSTIVLGEDTMDDSQFVIPVAAAGTTAYVPGTTVRDNLAQEAANAKRAASKTVEIFANNKRSKKS